MMTLGARGLGVILPFCIILAFLKMSKPRKIIIGGIYLSTLAVSFIIFISHESNKIITQTSNLYDILSSFVIGELFGGFWNFSFSLLLLWIIRVLVGGYCLFWLIREYKDRVD